jgi:hypothetical protein
LKNKFCLTVLLSSSLLFSGCDSETEDTTNNSNSTDNSSNVSGLFTDTTLPSEISADLTLSADVQYKIDGLVTVRNNATLTIPAGTTLYGSAEGYLVVAKGAKIMAIGTASNPIIFTSEAAFNGDTPARGQWGGVTLLGSANVNEDNLFYEVDESNGDFAFGTFNNTVNDAENSGTMKFIQILNSGFAVAPDKEVNGLSLCGIGSGTTIEDIVVTNSGDDGVELWGGTVNLKNILIKNAGDDSFDIDNGYTGTVTNLIIEQIEEAAAGIEMTNSGSLPRTNATFVDFKITTATTQKKEGGIYFKDDGVASTFSNGEIIHNGQDGALHSKKALSTDALTAISFSNVTLSGSAIKSDDATTKYSGPASAELQAKFEAQ